jgi:hypothetical protein
MKNTKISLALVLSPAALIVLWLPVGSYAGSTHCFGNNPIIDTGQTLCYSDVGGVITCPAPDGVAPQDASYNPPNLQASYTVDDTNLTVVDNRTGLMWRKCPDGLTTSNCNSGTITKILWVTALSACQTAFAGYTDWRLPNLAELSSLIYLGSGGSPYINPLFVGTPSGDSRFWTNTSYPTLLTSVYTVRFDTGIQLGTPKSSTYYVRCVRGGP